MSPSRCEAPLSYERFVDYWLGDLAAAEQDAFERHLLTCKTCGAQAETWAVDTAALAEGARLLPRGFLTPEELEELGDGAVVVEVRNAPELRLRIQMGAIHVFRISLDQKLSSELERLDVEYLKEGYADPIFHADRVPLSDSGKVHLACHSHVLNAHGDSTMRLIGTRNGERFTVFEMLVRFS